MVVVRSVLWGAAFAVACSSSESNPRTEGCTGSHCDGGSDVHASNGGARAAGGSVAMSGGAGSGAGGGMSGGGAAVMPDAGSSGGSETGVAGDASVGPAPEAAQCPPGRGDCDGRADNGCEINLMEHPNHCGTCARDCLGADCHHGLCDAIQLSTENVGDIAVASGSIYWMASNSIRASSTDGSHLRNISAPEGSVNFMAVGGDDLYWTDIGNWVFPNNFGNPGLVRVAPLVDVDGGGPRTLYTEIGRAHV